MVDTSIPTYPQYTNLGLGEGLFDQLMATVKHHLDEEYKGGRIKGAEYAKVYLGSMEAVMQNTTQYLLGSLLLKEQKDKVAAEIKLMEAQERQIDAEIDKIRAEIDLILLQGPLVQAQIDKIRAEIDLMLLQGPLIEAQIRKIDAEIIYLDAQADFMLKQGEKIDKEIEFLNAKIRTERANTEAGIADSDSVVGRQKSLLVAQKYGFAGDAEAKMAKLYADFDAVVKSVDEHDDQGLTTASTDAIGIVQTTASLMKGA